VPAARPRHRDRDRPGGPIQAISIHQHGGPEALRLEELPTPAPGPGEIRIRVRSAAVNLSDTMRRRDDPYPFPTSLPFVPGGEVAGTVDALGDGVEGPAIGTRVPALAGPDGSTGYAQCAIAAAERVVPTPEGVDEETASTVLVAGVMPLLALSEVARLQPGESVLVPAAAGGVGSYAVQLVRRLGAATVIALAGSAAKREAALELGADQALDSTDPGWPERVRELTGGAGVDVAGAAIGRLLGMLAAGEVTVPIHRRLPLARAAEARRLIESRELQGKLVLKFWA